MSYFLGMCSFCRDYYDQWDSFSVRNRRILLRYWMGYYDQYDMSPKFLASWNA